MSESGQQPASEPRRTLPKFQRNFATAVQLALGIKQKCPTVDGWVDIDPNLFAVLQEYRLEAVTLVESEELVDISISFFDPTVVRWVVMYPATFNFCYTRFAITKEVCHIITDDLNAVDADPWEENPSEQIMQAITVNEFLKGLDIEALLKKPIWDSETFCFFVAFEILLPENCNGLVELYMRGYPVFDIATMVKLPEALVAFFLKSRYFLFRQRLIEANFKLDQ